MKKRLISMFLGAMVIGMVVGCKADNVSKEVERIVVAENESRDTTVVHLEDNNNKKQMNFEIELILDAVKPGNFETELENSDPIKVLADNVKIDGKPVEVESADVIKGDKVELQISPIKGDIVEGEVVILKIKDGDVVKETLPFYIDNEER